MENGEDVLYLMNKRLRNFGVCYSSRQVHFEAIIVRFVRFWPYQEERIVSLYYRDFYVLIVSFTNCLDEIINLYNDNSI